MRKVASAVLGFMAVLYVAAIFVPFEPDERRPGTRLGGELVAASTDDWSFLADRNKIYVETRTWYLIPHSVTTIAWATDNVLYVPCGNCDAKRWPKNVARDANVRLKIGDRLYERRAVRLRDDEEIRQALHAPGAHALKDVAVFRMDPR